MIHSPLLPSLLAWAAHLADPRARLEVHERFIGHQVRTDRFRCTGLSREHHTIYLVLEGCAPVRSGGGAWVLQPGSFFWLPPGVPHDMEWPARFVFTEVWYRLVAPGPEASLSGPSEAIVLENMLGLLPLLQQIEDEVTLKRPAGNEKLRHLLAILTIEVSRQLAPAGEDELPIGPAQRTALARYAREHVARGLTPGDLAESIGLSPDYFARVFRRTYGCAPRQWIARQRLEAAARLLRETHLACFQVADRLGYASTPQFTRQFRSAFGVTPNDYRRRGRVK